MKSRKEEERERERKKSQRGTREEGRREPGPSNWICNREVRCDPREKLKETRQEIWNSGAGDFALKNADEAEVKKRQHASEILSSHFPFSSSRGSPPPLSPPPLLSDSLNSFDSWPLPLPRRS